MGNAYKVTDNRTGVAKKFHKLSTMLDEYPKEVFLQLANTIVAHSPVDTGTYMDNHKFVDTGSRVRPSGVASSHGKPRMQPKEPYAAAALARLTGQIEGVGKESRFAYFLNTSIHAPQVEVRHAPFQAARTLFPTIVQQAWSNVNGN